MTRRKLGATIAACALTLLAAACGSSGDSPSGLVTSGPGLSTAQPPWPPEYAHLEERVKKLGLPPVGDEKFHIHAALTSTRTATFPSPRSACARQEDRDQHPHPYDTTDHPHGGDPSVQIHARDFFSVWGVKLGPAQVGA
jgi:hypothetical protein